MQASSRVSKAEHATAGTAADAQTNAAQDDDKQYYPTSNGYNEPANTWEDLLVRLVWRVYISPYAQSYVHTHTQRYMRSVTITNGGVWTMKL